ncbi:SH3 domain-containing protein [Aciduricibacillus chroicocephali]|uniref:SH3 domain-containing protein n=1 Tax=Aciduricibacillus chroicocephali TaxID=3054939 RepID=A0ABY9KUH3_9BACI|nr:SH3 domain-containing protein [Bacillaceae bacterium 44XB]
MRSNRGKAILALLFVFILSLFNNTTEAEATKTKTGHVDIKSGVLNVRSGPGTNYKVIGTVNKNAKLTIYSETKNGWAETRLNNKKGYASKEFLRFYKKISNAEAKKITDKVIKTQRKVNITSKALTKKQIHKTMSPSFTKNYINKYIKYDQIAVGKNKNGETLYQAPGTDNPYYYIWDFYWKTNAPYIPTLPTVKYYEKTTKNTYM